MKHPPLPDTVFLTGEAAINDVRKRAKRMQNILDIHKELEAGEILNINDKLDELLKEPIISNEKDLTLF